MKVNSDNVALSHKFSTKSVINSPKAWGILAAVWSFYIFEYTLRVTPSVITHDLMSAYGVTASALGGLSSMYYLAYVPMQFPCGVAVDRYGPRIVVAASALLCAGGCILFSGSDSLLLSQMGRFLIGAGSACAYVCCGKVAAEWFSPCRYAMIMGFTMMMGTLGGISGGRPYALLVEHVGWRSSFLYAAALGVIISILAWSVIREKKELRSKHQPKIDEKELKSSVFAGILLIMKNSQQWSIGLYGCMMYLPLSAFAELWGVPYLMQAYGVSSAEAGIGTTMVFLGMAMGSALSPLISNWLESRLKVMKSASVLTFIFFALAIYMPDISLNTMFGILFLAGLSSGGQILYFAAAKELSPPNISGTSVGFTNGLVMVSGLIFQPLLGVLLDYIWSGSYNDLGSPEYLIEDYRFAFSIVLGAILVSRFLLNNVEETFERDDD